VPYPGELAGKTGHSEILSNPEVKEFLKLCAGIPEPKPHDFSKLTSGLVSVAGSTTSYPELVLAIDGSSYEASVDQRAPSRRVGYVKISSVLLNFDRYREMRSAKQRFVDPVELNQLKKNTSALSFALPGSYMIMKPGERVTDAFRRRIFESYSSQQTMLLGTLSLKDTLHELIRLADRHESGGTSTRLERCPGEAKDGSACSASGIPISLVDGKGTCSACGAAVYTTDLLRIHEAFVDSGPNTEALNRLMMVTEHLLIAHYINAYRTKALDVLSKLAIVVDGPLAVFGQAAWIHRAILRLILSVNEELEKAGNQRLLIVGFQKTGRLREHLDQIDHLLKPGTLFAVADEYRYTFVDPGKKGSEKNFGDETYYGQDFLVKMPSERCFACLLPYPFNKAVPNFRERKAHPKEYRELGRAIGLIRELESAMFGGAIVPVMLAHGNASISIMPGGKVLDVASRAAVMAGTS
jgi:hypothetical protein